MICGNRRYRKRLDCFILLEARILLRASHPSVSRNSGVDFSALGRPSNLVSRQCDRRLRRALLALLLVSIMGEPGGQEVAPKKKNSKVVAQNKMLPTITRTIAQFQRGLHAGANKLSYTAWKTLGRPTCTTRIVSN